MGGTDTVFAPNLSRAGPPDLSGHSGGDDLLLQGAPTRYRLDLSSLIFHPVIKYLNFIENKAKWGVHFQGSIRTIPEEDFRLIESEMKKAIAERPKDNQISQSIKPAE